MRFRNSRLRTKIVALLVSLAALWAFAAWVTLREGLNLLGVSTIDEKVTRPTLVLVTALQEERRLSMIYLGRPGSQRLDMGEQRVRTDKAVASFRQQTGGSDVSRAASSELEGRITETIKQMDALTPARRLIDAGQMNRTQLLETYNRQIDAPFRIFSSANAGLEENIAKDSRSFNSLIRAKEVLSREDALLSGVLAADRFSGDEHAQFVQLVGSQRFLHSEAAAELPRADRARYDQLVESPEFSRFRLLEDRVVDQGRAQTRPAIGRSEWESAVQPTLSGLERVVLTGRADLVKRAEPIAAGVITRLVLAGGLGLLAVIASIIVSITTASALVQQLTKLRNAARQLAHERLPRVVERLGQGEKVDVAAEAPPLEFGDDEIGQVGQVFNTVQETAVRVAVEQAELRRSIRDTLLSLARRTQVLVHQQLTLLDKMERREQTTQELEDLFRVDHLATRMRRNAENLIVLSGATPARGWRRSMPMIDVVRGAVAEVEDYTRVHVLPGVSASLAGRAVGDITHLLAELIENAVSYSPPYTIVQVSWHRVASGYAVEVEDRGLGMGEDKLAAANERIISPQEINLSSDTRLGLYVVSRLAGRYGIKVSLKRSPYGGTTAIVLIPRDLMAEQAEGEAAPAAAATTGNGHPLRALPGRMGLVNVLSEGDTTGTDARPGKRGMADPAAPGAAGPGRPAPHAAPVDVPAPGQADAPAAVADQGAAPEPAGARGEPGTGYAAGQPNGQDTAEGVPQGDVPPPRQSAPRPPAGRPPYAGEPRHAVAPPGPGRGSDLPEIPPGAETTQSGPPLRTPSGLPFRVPQASLARQLRDTGAAARPAQPRPAPRADDRSPEEIRSMLGSYQRGTARGRSEAARSMGQNADPVAAARAPEATDRDQTLPRWRPAPDPGSSHPDPRG
jgi:signal transduction histidine kinase